jgi:hypothetical protein
MLQATTMNIVTDRCNTMVVPILKSSQDVSSTESQLSPRSPLECEYDGHEDKPKVSKISVEPEGNGKSVSFSAPLPPNEGTPESTSTAKTVESELIVSSQNGSVTVDLQAIAAEHIQKLLSDKVNPSKRRIQWAKRVKVKEIRHLNEIPASEREGLWMSLADQQMNKAMVRTTVTMMMRGECISDDDPDFCTRGLEFRTKAGSKIRSRYKLRVRSAVLNEQDLQREEGFVDADFIAMASMDESAECREAALQRGMQDAKRIEKYLEDARLEFRLFHLQ